MGKTIAQKIFDSHLVDKPFEGTYVLKLDRVFCHEITTPVAINDLAERGKDRVFDPEKIKAIMDSLGTEIKKMEDQGKTPIVVLSPIVRMYFKKISEDYYSDLIVVSYNEIESDIELQSVGMVSDS